MCDHKSVVIIRVMNAGIAMSRDPPRRCIHFDVWNQLSPYEMGPMSTLPYIVYKHQTNFHCVNDLRGARVVFIFSLFDATEFGMSFERFSAGFFGLICREIDFDGSNGFLINIRYQWAMDTLTRTYVYMQKQGSKANTLRRTGADYKCHIINSLVNDLIRWFLFTIATD